MVQQDREGEGYTDEVRVELARTSGGRDWAGGAAHVGTSYEQRVPGEGGKLGADSVLGAMQPIVLSATVGHDIVRRAEDANPVIRDDGNRNFVQVPAPVRRAVIEARAITLGSFLGLLGLLVLPYVWFKRKVSGSLACEVRNAILMRHSFDDRATRSWLRSCRLSTLSLPVRRATRPANSRGRSVSKPDFQRSTSSG